MAGKTIIHELCPMCGRLAAWQNHDGTAHTIVHGCVVKETAPHSFLPSEVIFVPINKSNDVVELVLANRELQAKNSRLSADLREMAKDCARLQKVLLDIGSKVCDVLGREVCGVAFDLVGRVSPQNSWQCTCGMQNYPVCTNCGRKNE